MNAHNQNIYKSGTFINDSLNLLSSTYVCVKIREQHQITSLEAVHNASLELSKFEHSSWDLADLTIYQFYFSPECTYKSQKDFFCFMTICEKIMKN